MLRAAHSEQAPLRKGTWTSEEDQKLTSYIKSNGIWNWNSLPRAAGLLRSGKSCRLRWVNYLRPDLKHGNFNNEEVETIIKLQGIMGNKWSKIAARLPGRTDNEIKNFWNAHLKKRLKKRIDQTTDAFQGTQKSRIESRPKDDIFHGLPKASKAADTLECRRPMLQQSTADLSSPSNSFIELDNIHTCDEQNIDFLEFSRDVQTLCRQPLAVEPTLSFYDGSVLHGNQIEFQDCIQQPCTSYVSLPTTPNTLCSGLPNSPKLSTANFSSLSSDPTVEINQSSVVTENKCNSPGLTTQLPSFWERPISVEGLTKVEDDASTLIDQIWLDGYQFPTQNFACEDDFWVPTFM